ncbi:protein CREG1-like [Bacillus rossius redtenbacheri]|uniref:protein CREG1-like n=1 Tax=Bacillus rossius redtenbacheri TaxID=93214 RepID=UPI002FDCCC7E
MKVFKVCSARKLEMVKLNCLIFQAVLLHVATATTIQYGKFDADHNFRRVIKRIPYKQNFQIESNNVESLDSVVTATPGPSPPPHTKYPEMARFIVHNSDWAALSYVSFQKETQGYPVGAIFSISDGPREQSTGTPYLYVTDLELSVQDLRNDSRCSLTMTLAEGQYCQQHGLDQQDPPCAQIVLTGRMQRLQNGTREWDFARQALFSRHPRMKGWPSNHSFFFMKLKIDDINMTDFYGGPVYVDVEQYFKAKM